MENEFGLMSNRQWIDPANIEAAASGQMAVIFGNLYFDILLEDVPILDSMKTFVKGVAAIRRAEALACASVAKLANENISLEDEKLISTVLETYGEA